MAGRHAETTMKTESPQLESVAQSSARFRTTHWSVVLAAGNSNSPESRLALDRLCQTYWYPLYAFVRHQGCPQPDAEDRVQQFFARLLEKRYVSRADPARGRFRSFLLSAFRHFLANEWDRKTAAKRGGLRQFFSWDELDLEARYAADAGDHWTPERVYERTWALSLLSDVRKRLAREWADDGRTDRFGLLEQFLPGAESGLSYAQLAERWGVKEVTVRAETHHLRKRYAVLLRETVADLVSNPGDVEDELRALIAAVSN
jgi:RNA polymerase sigma-70 factor (ECF subfamily)